METLTRTLKALYRECFSDSEECTDYLFSGRLGAHNAVYKHLNGELAVAMYLVDKTLVYCGQHLNVPYVVALATSPKYRKQGLAQRLLQQSAAASAAPFIMLYPAISGFYEKMGFVTISRDDVIDYADFGSAPASAEDMSELYGQYVRGMDYYIPMTARSFEEMRRIAELDGGGYNMLVRDGVSCGFGNGEEGILLGGVKKKSGAMARIACLEAAFALTSAAIPCGIKLTDGMIQKNNRCFKVENGGLIDVDGWDIEVGADELTRHFFGERGKLKEFFPPLDGYILERY